MGYILFAQDAVLFGFLRDALPDQPAILGIIRIQTHIPLQGYSNTGIS